MIYVPLQDLHLVQSMNWIGELSRRYHSVRMHILTPYGEVFPTLLSAVQSLAVTVRGIS